MAAVLTCIALSLSLAQTAPALEAPPSPSQPSHVYLGLLTGSPAGLEISWLLDDRISWVTAGGFKNTDRGAWLATSDIHYLFVDAIGELGAWGRLVLYAGLGGQARYETDEDDEISFGGRSMFGIKLVVDAGKYEMFATVAPGLYYQQRTRASLDGFLGLRLRLGD